jgi:predicted TIM-barrel enzyme
MAGRGSLSGLMPYGNANQVVKEMAHEVLTAVHNTPVLAGVCGTDPFMIRDHFLREIKDLGFAGIQNFPTVGLIDGTLRANLEETGMSYSLEVEVIAQAHAMDLLTTPYVFNVAEARQMTEAGADIVVAHMGLTTSGAIGAQTARTLDQSVRARCRPSPTPANPCVPIAWCCAMAGPSPPLQTPATSWNAAPASRAFMAPAPWNACLWKSPSPPR